MVLTGFLRLHQGRQWGVLVAGLSAWAAVVVQQALIVVLCR
jgi:hypothetical protein